MIKSPITPPTAAPAIVPLEVLFELVAAAVASLSVVVLENEDAVSAEEILLDLDVDITALQPREGILSAKPSIGCAYALAPLVLAAQGCKRVEPSVSYATAVCVASTVNGL